MKCLSLFSGIGGFDIAAKNQGHEIVGACEIDKYATEIYERHFPGVKIWKDAKEIKPKELPDFDILFGGFPCQAFSIAGQRQGFMDTRGTLFFEIARIAKEKRPRLLLLENVKGLLNHQGGDTFRTILSTLDEMGYDTEWQVINSKYFVPQNRERVYIIGHLRGFSRRQIFPIGEYNQINNGARPKTQGKGKRIQEQNSASLQTSPHKGTATLVYIAQKNANMKKRIQERDETWCLTNNSADFGIIEKEPQLKPLNCARQGYRVYDKSGIGQCLNSQCGGLGAKMGLVLDQDEQFPVVNNRGKLSRRERAQCLDANYWKGYDNHGARTLIASPTQQEQQEKYGIYEGAKIRRLTPLECERLQGFPDGYTKFGTKDNIISDTQRYKCLGNAVTVSVVEYILQAIAKKYNLIK